MAKNLIKKHEDWEVYQLSFNAAMEIFELSKLFPKEEKYSLTDQIRRSSRSVCANLTEAWRRRRYLGSFLLRLNDAEAEAAETQTWLKFAVKCEYINAEQARPIYAEYNHVISKIVLIINNPSPWILRNREIG